MRFFSCSRRVIVLLTASLAALLMVGLGMGASDTSAQASPGVLPPQSRPYGRSYGEWSVKWWQWAVSIPANNHPLLDTGPCNVAQSGSVWFLGGRFSPGSVTRNCTVPRGMALFFPVANVLDDNVGRPPPPYTAAQLLAEAAAAMDGATGLSAQLDGAPIAGLTPKGPYRAPSPGGFSYTYPSNSLFCAVGACPPYLPGGDTVSPAVADGVYLMLAPLPTGQHLLHFAGTIPAFGNSLDVTYHLTVLP